MVFAVIGGSGFSKFGFINLLSEKSIETPFGLVDVFEIEISRKKGFFLPRHGKGHKYPPHLIPYRANIYALKLLGVERIIATSAVGSLNENMTPGSFVIPDQFIDFTKSREASFSTEGRVYHIDFTEPFCPEIAESIIRAANKLGIPVISGGTYVVTEGPRFETPAEIKAFKILGGDLVGMTLVPECVLARELNMCYITISTVTNMAAGISTYRLTATEVEEMMKEKQNELFSLIEKAIEFLPEVRKCSCKDAFKGAKV